MTASNSSSSSSSSSNTSQYKVPKLIDWNFSHFSTHITIMVFLLVMIGLRILYRSIHAVKTYIPESFILLVAGILFGLVLPYITNQNSNRWQLTPDLFFTFLLPPIVLDSAYQMYNRAITDYMCVIFMFAVFGTVLNFILISGIMLCVYKFGWFGLPPIQMDFKCFLLFASFIIAVDPVAVLATFQAIGVDLGLYYTVFGESIFNDAVTVVLYQVVSTFATAETINLEQIVMGILSFFAFSLGGLLVGIIMGVLTCIITRVPSTFGPCIVLIIGYFSYIMGDCLGWSGIISMIGCGVIQTAYAFHNMSKVSVVVVRKVTKLVAELSESVIFLFIGLETISLDLAWHTGFCLWALVACLIARALVIASLSKGVNVSTGEQTRISCTEQVILIYGGLRGAVCFCLAVLIKPHYFINDGEYKRQVFITATLFVICFTIIVMGMTMKPLVAWLHIPMQQKSTLSLFHQLHEFILDEALTGIEAIIGKMGRNAARDIFYSLDDRYIRPVLQRDPETHEQKIVKLYEKIALKLHYATMQPSKSHLYLNQIPGTILTKFDPITYPAGIEPGSEHSSLFEAPTLVRSAAAHDSNSSDGQTVDEMQSDSSHYQVDPAVTECCGKKKKKEKRDRRKKTKKLSKRTAMGMTSSGLMDLEQGPRQTDETENNDGLSTMKHFMEDNRRTSLNKQLPIYRATPKIDTTDEYLGLLMSKTLLASKLQRHSENKSISSTTGFRSSTFIHYYQPPEGYEDHYEELWKPSTSNRGCLPVLVRSLRQKRKQLSELRTKIGQGREPHQIAPVKVHESHLKPHLTLRLTVPEISTEHRHLPAS